MWLCSLRSWCVSAWHACGCDLLDHTACVYVRARDGLVCVAVTVSPACVTCVACAGGVLALTSGACWHSAFACELLSVHAHTSGVGGSDGIAQAAGPSTGDPYVGGPGIKAIHLAASPGTSYPGNFGTGGHGPGASGECCLGQSQCVGFKKSLSESLYHFFPFSPLI